MQFVHCPQIRSFWLNLIEFINICVQFRLYFFRYNVWENRRQQSIFLPLSHHRFLIGKKRMEKHGKWENYTSGFLWFFIIFLSTLFSRLFCFLYRGWRIRRHEGSRSSVLFVRLKIFPKGLFNRRTTKFSVPFIQGTRPVFKFYRKLCIYLDEIYFFYWKITPCHIHFHSSSFCLTMECFRENDGGVERKKVLPQATICLTLNLLEILLEGGRKSYDAS